MPTSTLRCRCGCKTRGRRESLLFVAGVPFIDREHERAFRTKPKKAKAAKPKKKKLKSIARLRNDVAELLQKLVRMKAADAQGFAKCVTCDKTQHWTELQGGHFIERGRGATKLLEENIKPQCAYCNKWGMKQTSTILTYRNHMVDTHGENFVKELERLSKQTVKHTRHELEGLAFDFKRQIQSQEARLAGRGLEQREEVA